MAELLWRLGEALPLAAVGVSLVGGALGLAYVNRGARRNQPDRGAAAVVALALGLVVGAVAAVLTAAIGSAWGGGDVLAALPLAALFFGLPAAMTTFGASVLGYAVVSRWRPGTSGVAGAVLGPVALGAACLAGMGLVGLATGMVADAALEQERAEVAEQSRGLHLKVDEVVTTLDDAGLVARVRVRLTIRSDEELVLEQLPGKLVYPLFVISPAGGDDPNEEIQAEAPPGNPAVLAAGSTTPYDVTFDPSLSGTPSRSAPGAWLLTIAMSGADGQRYGLETAIAVGQ